MQTINRNYILYNPYAGNGDGEEAAIALEVVYDNAVRYDITKIKDYKSLFETMDESDHIILCGGDGTLNRFVNGTQGLSFPNFVYFYSIGNGNDFIQDIGRMKAAEPFFRINEYLQDLPMVKVKDVECLFVNGVTSGLMSAGAKSIMHHKPVNVEIVVDKKSYRFEKVWMISVTKGRYCNSGMMLAPEHNRLDAKLSIRVLHGIGKYRMVKAFRNIVKGKHSRYKKQIGVINGYDVRVIPEEPVSVNIDGEIIYDVTEYSVICEQADT